MASHKSPLRDRLLSNSPDPIKTSILRESGMGWNAQSTGSMSSSSSSITSPLRIAKRDSPSRLKGPPVARRSSSSYKHMHSNNLVSKSPFKSQIPTPATPTPRPAPIAITFPTSTPTRRVSGEKRPRPSSMHEQTETENKRPFSLKRERKQSKVLEGLLEREPVTKSPFKLQPRKSSMEVKSPPPPPPPPAKIRPPSFVPQTPSRIRAPTAVSPGPFPGRSVLVSKRMHGPRLSGSGRRERRKTVSFDERCDVVEFDRDEETDEEVFQSASDEEAGSEDSEQEPEDPSPMAQPLLPAHEPEDDQAMDQDESFDSIQLSDLAQDRNSVASLLDPDTSITGIVDEMFFSPNARALLPDNSIASNISTPPRHSDIPTDLETEDGVPFGRSHHVERFLLQQQHASPHLQQPPHFSPIPPPHQYSPRQRSPGVYPFNLNLPTRASPNGPPATPPRRSPGMMHSTPPLGRSTHAERIKQVREDDNDEDEDVGMLPPSPSPMKKIGRHANIQEGLVPRFDISEAVNTSVERDLSANIGADPFKHSRIQDVSAPLEIDGHSSMRSEEGTSNISIGNSEINLSHLGKIEDISRNEESYHDAETGDDDDESNASTEREVVRHSPSFAGSKSLPARAVSPLTRDTSPSTRVSSPLLNITSSNQTLGIGVRPRISKDDVKRRLLGRRSIGSPSPEQSSPPPGQANENKEGLQINVEGASRDILSLDEEDQDEDRDKDRDRMSIMTGMTDISTETAIVAQAERGNFTAGSLVSQDPEAESNKEFGLLGTEQLKFDFGSKFGLGGLGISSEDGFDNMDVLSNANVKPFTKTSEPTNVVRNTGRVGYTASSGMKMGNRDVDMDMKSALDRLMEDVAGGKVEDSMITDDSYDQSQDSHMSENTLPQSSTSRPKILERAATDTVLHSGTMDGVTSRTASGSSVATLPPPVPPKDNIKAREQLILDRRREARRLEDEEEDEFCAQASKGRHQHLGVGRPSRRRSMSTGDVEDLGGGAKRRGNALLDITQMEQSDLLGGIEEELNKMVEQPKKSRYHVRQHQGTIYASSSEEKVSHMAGPGDVNAGKAWRAVRRPSDMNEYAKQIREYRAQEKGKAYGKVFVKVIAVKNMHLPLPREPTIMTCTLNNGIHFVTTPECQLGQDSHIDQEFELIEHNKLEFTLTIKVRRDPHVIAQFKAVVPTPIAAPPPPPAPIVQSTSKSSGMRSFFSSSPKKSKEKIVVQPAPPPPPQPQQPERLTENLARYLKSDGTLARAFISFKDVVHRCDTRMFETSYPLIGQRAELGGKQSTQQVGEIVLQMFRLPPLPGVPQDQLPQSLEECHRGLRHINWHKVTYFQGTLTQSGGDCSTWRRRQFRVIGGNLVSFNDVTKKATATIDLKKAIAIEDDQESNDSSRYEDLYGVERSFRLIFPAKQEIIFFADTDEEKSKWLEVLRALVGRIPPHPLWAELLWQRQDELSKRAQAAHQVAKPYVPPASLQPNPR